jgi:hypothetical protein
MHTVLDIIFTALVVVVGILWAKSAGDVPPMRTSAAPGARVTVTLVLFIAWALLTGYAAESGFLADTSGPPRLFLFVLPAFATVITLGLTSFGFYALENESASVLVGVQVVRVVIEILLWQLHGLGLVPVQMTFEGRNFDVLIGAAAPVVAALVAQERINPWGVIVWNAVGLLSLLNIVVVSALSVPGPMQVFTAEPGNRIVLSVPWVWLPAIIVPSVIFIHVVSIRQSVLNLREPDLPMGP